MARVGEKIWQAASRLPRLTCLGPSACSRAPAVRFLGTSLFRDPIVDCAADLLARASAGPRFDFAKSDELLSFQHHGKPLLRRRHVTSMCRVAHHCQRDRY